MSASATTVVKMARAPGVANPAKPAHSQAPTSTSTVSSQTVATGFRPSMTPSITATSASAVKTRSLSTLLGLARLFASQAETAFAAAECGDRIIEMRDRKIRPQHLADIQLGVCKIPQQEIADAMIAAGADEQIGVDDVAELQ